MELGRLLGLLSGLAGVAINGELCTRRFSTRASCRKCQEVCPVGGISFSHDRPVVDECNGCGFCSAVCPNGVFSLKDNGDSFLLNRCRELANQYGHVLVYCTAHTGEGAKFTHGLPVTCLGRLAPELLVGMVGESGSIQILKQKHVCTGCALHRGGELFDQWELRTRTLLECLGYSGELKIITDLDQGELVRRISQPPVRVNCTNRRDFFSSMFRGARQAPVVVLDSILGPPRRQPTPGVGDETGRSPSPRQELFLTYINRLVKSDRLHHPLAGVRVVEPDGACYFCGACVRLCPTGALRRAEVDKYTISLCIPRCTGCGLCGEICPQAVLRSTREVTASELANRDFKPITVGSVKGCTRCGTSFTGNDMAEVCLRCNLEQRWQQGKEASQ